MPNVAVALGSNLGDRHRTLRDALAALTPTIRDLRVSTFHETEPVGVTRPQPLFLNAAAAGKSVLSPRDLLGRLLATEEQFGRERPYEGAARTLDLDLILYDDQVIDEPGLVVPHPRFREREFVLRPLAEIAPDWRDPVSGHTMTQLLALLVRSR